MTMDAKYTIEVDLDEGRLLSALLTAVVLGDTANEASTAKFKQALGVGSTIASLSAAGLLGKLGLAKVAALEVRVRVACGGPQAVEGRTLYDEAQRAMDKDPAEQQARRAASAGGN